MTILKEGVKFYSVNGLPGVGKFTVTATSEESAIDYYLKSFPTAERKYCWAEVCEEEEYDELDY